MVFLQIEKKCDQMRKQLRKSDKEYCELCEKAEAARQEWEFNVAKVRLKRSRSCIEWHVHCLVDCLVVRHMGSVSAILWQAFEISIAKVTLKYKYE